MGFREGLDVLWVRRLVGVESADGLVVELEASLVDECLDGGRIAAGCVDKFLARHFLDGGYGDGVGGQLVPVGYLQIRVERLQLLGGAYEHVELVVQRPLHCCQFVASGFVEWLAGQGVWQADVGLEAWTVAVLLLHALREGCLQDVPKGRHIVVAYPLPQFILLGEQHGMLVEHDDDVFDVVPLGSLVSLGVGTYRHDKCRLGLCQPKRHLYSHQRLHLGSQTLRHGIGEEGVKRQWQYDVNVCHALSCCLFLLMRADGL